VSTAGALSLLALPSTEVQILTPEELLAAKLLAEAAHATWREYSGTQFTDISCNVLFFILIFLLIFLVMFFVLFSYPTGYIDDITVAVVYA